MWEIVIAVVVLIAAVLILAARRPDSFRVERATSIGSPPDRIFPLINDFKHWSSWSPYEKKDPAMKRTFAGEHSGKGAVYEWDGNAQVGKGRIEIIAASAPSRLTIKLDMNFTLEPRGAATQLTWAMRGTCSCFMGKLMGLLLNTDKMIGKDFEVGLANLKALAEG
jgi:hypothetical protein